MLKSKEPKVLIISNNALSETKNNGKTLASFFRGFNSENVSQLYFNPELPSGSEINSYYQITEKDVLKSLFNMNHKCGTIVGLDSSYKNKTNKKTKSRITLLKKYNLVRILREVIWLFNNWNSEKLNSWLEEVSPDIIFFCAGDSGFAYSITGFIKRKFNSKLIIYITDDYVLPRRTLSLFWWLRRNYILAKMKDCINKSDLFITISEKMQETYKEFLGRDSMVAINISESLKDESLNQKNETDKIVLAYAGGLHFNRHKTLELLIDSIGRYNKRTKNRKKLFLRIFSGSEPDPAILSKLNSKDTSQFEGKLNSLDLKRELNKCHIPVHVESFDKKSIESTKLSISTKIPEYLSLGKPILAIGPKEVASMDYLKDTALCVNDPCRLYDSLASLIENEENQSKLAERSLELYEKNHNPITMSKYIYSAIIGVCKNCEES